MRLLSPWLSRRDEPKGAVRLSTSKCLGMQGRPAIFRHEAEDSKVVAISLLAEAKWGYVQKHVFPAGLQRCDYLSLITLI